MLSTKIEKDRAVLVGVCLSHENYEEKLSSLDELERLVVTAEIEVVGKHLQKRNKINPHSYAGTGFIQSIVEEMESLDAGMLIFDNNLSPAQVRNLQKEYEIDVIDRTEVILKIFHDHARTQEARLQVKLAELEYQLPRLKRLWGHLDRERGSSGSSASRGMGEKQIEVDRRLIEQEITSIKKRLEKIATQVETARKRRLSKKKVCLVGYTNAGKSTLFNRLTHAGVLVENKLFATLDSTARALELGRGQDAILSDTVGFISNLPHNLVASFRATLKEVVDADLLLHVVDLSDAHFEKYIRDVQAVLTEIGADEVPQLYVFNKADRLTEDEIHNRLLGLQYGDSVVISARTGRNVDQLLQQMDDVLYNARPIELLVPFSESKVIGWIHDFGEILQKEYQSEGVRIKAVLNQEDMRNVEEFVIV